MTETSKAHGVIIDLIKPYSTKSEDWISATHPQGVRLNKRETHNHCACGHRLQFYFVRQFISKTDPDKKAYIEIGKACLKEHFGEMTTHEINMENRRLGKNTICYLCKKKMNTKDHLLENCHYICYAKYVLYGKAKENVLTLNKRKKELDSEEMKRLVDLEIEKCESLIMRVEALIPNAKNLIPKWKFLDGKLIPPKKDDTNGDIKRVNNQQILEIESEIMNVCKYTPEDIEAIEEKRKIEEARIIEEERIRKETEHYNHLFRQRVEQERLKTIADKMEREEREAREIEDVKIKELRAAFEREEKTIRDARMSREKEYRLVIEIDEAEEREDEEIRREELLEALERKESAAREIEDVKIKELYDAYEREEREVRLERETRKKEMIGVIEKEEVEAIEARGVRRKELLEDCEREERRKREIEDVKIKELRAAFEREEKTIREAREIKDAKEKELRDKIEREEREAREERERKQRILDDIEINKRMIIINKKKREDELREKEETERLNNFISSRMASMNSLANTAPLIHERQPQDIIDALNKCGITK